jgi:hypothetical protein
MNVKEKGYLKSHVVVKVNNKNKKILSMKVTADERVHDRKALPEFVEKITKSTRITT